jgi:hypothetical protein
MIIRLLLAAAIVMPCLGCASATRGTTESISIASTPPGATADVSGLDNPTACVTPCVVQVKRNADITVSINKPGYEPQVVPLTKEVAGSGAAGFAGNVLVGGLVGMGVAGRPQRRARRSRDQGNRPNRSRRVDRRPFAVRSSSVSGVLKKPPGGAEAHAPSPSL